MWVRGRRCAAKKLHGIFNARDVPPKERSSMTERFETECRRVLYLSHPSIIEMIGIHFDRATRLPTLVMELMDTSLRHYLESNPKSSVTLPTKYSILHDVAGGLVYLHSLPPPLGPIVHRDLTSSNILLSLGSAVVAKIADLGQAKIDSKYATRQQQLTMGPGNPDHMPPEASMDNPEYNASLDVFSLGVVMLHTLTHEWPNPLARMKSYTEARLEVDRRKPHLDKITGNPLKPLVVQCFNQEPSRRPTTSEVFRLVEQQYKAAKGELLEKAAEGKRKKEIREVKEALHVPPDESLPQERLLRQCTEEKKRKEDQRKMSGSNPGPPRRGEHIYNIPSSPATLAGGEVQPQHKPPVSQGYTNPDPRQNHPGVSAGGVPSTQGGMSVNTPHSPNLHQQAGSTVAYAGHPTQGPPANMGVGSPVELVQDPTRHGVVMWLGTLPEARGLVAGVELVSI